VDPDITVRIALDTDADDPAPVWTDVTDRIHYGAGGQPVNVVIGRQDDQAVIKPTELGFALQNGDNRFTPRNPDSDLYGKWEHGKRANIQETVDGAVFDLGTGFVSMPDMKVVDPRSAQAVTVTAMDWMGKLEGAPAFEGTLTEFIRADQDTGLVEWFPLADPTLPMMSALTTAQLPLAVRTVGAFPAAPGVDPHDLVAPARFAGPPGDEDAQYPEWFQSMSEDGTTFLGDARLVGPVDVTVSSGEVLAISFWAYLRNHDLDPGISPPNSSAIELRSADLASQILIGGDGGTLHWEATVVAGGGSVAADAGRQLETDVWRLITVRVALPSGAVDLWIGSDLAATATIASPPSSMTFAELRVASFVWVGSLAQVQIRVAPAVSAFTRADHIAQHRHGYRGLQRQTVGERIVTLARYAGVPDTEVDVPASASTPMQVAKLAGVNPAQALRAAADTGQDTLITSGDGKITVIPRAQRYNQPVTLQIPFGWIGWRGMTFRPDTPITDVAVSRVDGGTVRLVNRANRSRYGVAGLTYTLDTAIDADAANLASWALTAHGQPRTRCPSIEINMLRRTFAERKQLLALAAGDRIEITGLPDGYPDDLPHLILQGIEHTIGPGRVRKIRFNTSPLLGPAPGEPPPCPVVGDLVGPDAVIAY
jgi:hypothetical protein